jgi:hypothetical protein
MTMFVLASMFLLLAGNYLNPLDTYALSRYPIIPSLEQSGQRLDCSKPKALNIFVTKGEKRSVNIAANGRVLRSIDVPWQADSGVSGFGLNRARKTKNGFEITIEYGSRFYYHKRFVFVCRGNSLYLTNIFVESFDKRRPEIWTRKTQNVRPALPLEAFKLMA